MRRALPYLMLALAIGLFTAGPMLVRLTDVDFSLAALEGVRAWVGGFGALGPAVFVTLVTFRTFLFLPSHLVLLLGGLLFGAVGGTAWGALGLTLCGLLQYAFARVLGDEWLRPRAGPRLKALERRVRRAGPWIVGLAASHPAGPMTPVNLAAGAGGVPAATFLLALVAATPVRAACYSVLGSSLLDWSPAVSAGVAALLLALVLLPLAIPRLRNLILAGESEPS